jgi:hypothetical protein
VILPDGMNLNQELVRQGLWADPQPVPPWEWRKKK